MQAIYLPYNSMETDKAKEIERAGNSIICYNNSVEILANWVERDGGIEWEGERVRARVWAEKFEFKLA